MKKLVTLLAVLLCSSIAYCQGTSLLMNWEAKQYLNSHKKVSEEKTDSIKKAIEIEVIKHENKNKSNDIEVFVYCGREGHMMALGNLFKEDSNLFDNIVKWLKIIFLNQPLPNETEEEYKARIECLGLPANQPFK